MNVNLKKLAVTATMAGAVGGMAAMGIGAGAAHADRNLPVPPIPVPNIPDVDVPPVNVPAVYVPPVNVPPVNVPNVDLPNVDVPNVDLPNVDVPNVDVPDLKFQDVNMPNLDVPRVNFPDVDIPEVKLPPNNIGWNDFVKMPPGHIGQLLGIPPGQLEKYDVINVNGTPQPNPFYGKSPGQWRDITEVPKWWQLVQPES